EGAEADAGAHASALFAALGLLGFLRLGRSRAPPSGTLRLGLGRRAAFGRRSRLALFLLTLTDLADELGLGHLGRRFGAGRRHFLGSRRPDRRDRPAGPAA